MYHFKSKMGKKHILHKDRFNNFFFFFFLNRLWGLQYIGKYSCLRSWACMDIRQYGDQKHWFKLGFWITRGSVHVLFWCIYPGCSSNDDYGLNISSQSCLAQKVEKPSLNCLFSIVPTLWSYGSCNLMMIQKDTWWEIIIIRVLGKHQETGSSHSWRVQLC